MKRMQDIIEKVLQRPNQTRFTNPTINTIPTLPSFAITELSIFLRFEKDLANERFFNIVFERTLKTCQYYLKLLNVLGTCLNVFISKDILTFFEWESETSEYHSLSKCVNFLRLFHKIVDSVIQDRRRFSTQDVEKFLREQLRKEPKQIFKFPKFTKDQTFIIKKPTAYTSVHKVKPNRKIAPHRVMNFTAPRTSSIGIDDADLQSQITSSEIDLNVIKDCDETLSSDNHNYEEDTEMPDTKDDVDYEEPEIDTETNTFGYGDSAASIIELHSDNAECGFEIVNC